jgi:KTSC domain
MSGKIKHPDLTEVKSSNIQSMGHEGETLWIRFKGGGLYSYPNVPYDVYQEGMASESKGSWFRDKVRGVYGHRKHDG